MDSLRAQTNAKLDDEFVIMLTKIENGYLAFNRHIQIRVERWVEKLLSYDQNTQWRKIRNSYLKRLLHMVMNHKIQPPFTRMPPDTDLAPILDPDIKVSMDTHGKEPYLLSHQIKIHKIEQSGGDTGTSSVTPSCETNRSYQTPKQSPSNRRLIAQTNIKTQNSINNNNNNNNNNKQNKQTHIFHSQSHTKASTKRNKKPQILQRIGEFLVKNQSKLQGDNEYHEIMALLGKKCNKKQEIGDESADLKVEEGIQANKINLFQFGSPRGMTQMQYFKAALQL